MAMPFWSKAKKGGPLPASPPSRHHCPWMGLRATSAIERPVCPSWARTPVPWHRRGRGWGGEEAVGGALLPGGQTAGFFLQQEQAHSSSMLGLSPPSGSGCVFLVCVLCVCAVCVCVCVCVCVAGHHYVSTWVSLCAPAGVLYKARTCAAMGSD